MESRGVMQLARRAYFGEYSMYVVLNCKLQS